MTESDTGISLCLNHFAQPREAVSVSTHSIPSPCEEEALIALEFAPVNPADLNVLEGKYGTLPQLPAVPGVEGVGRVIQIGKTSNKHASWLGKRVLLPAGYGSWRQFGKAPLADLTIVPESVPEHQAAMLRINPATALCLLREFVTLRPGDWIVQNAANSGVGRGVIQIARACGWRTINVVRRPGLEQELTAIGADVVLEEGEQLPQRINQATQGGTVRLGLNAVGGECALALAKALCEGGHLVTYGAMSLQPLRIPNSLLIFKNLQIKGFWVSRWYRDATQDQKNDLFRALFNWASSGILHTPVEAVYPLTDHAAAISHAMQQKRSGKVLFKG